MIQMPIIKTVLQELLTLGNIKSIVGLFKRKGRMDDFKEGDLVSIRVDSFEEKWKVISFDVENKLVNIQNKRFGGVKISVPVKVLQKA